MTYKMTYGKNIFVNKKICDKLDQLKENKSYSKTIKDLIERNSLTEFNPDRQDIGKDIYTELDQIRKDKSYDETIKDLISIRKSLKDDDLEARPYCEHCGFLDSNLEIKPNHEYKHYHIERDKDCKGCVRSAIGIKSDNNEKIKLGEKQIPHEEEQEKFF